MAFIRVDGVTLHLPIYNFQSRSLRNVLLSVGTGGNIRREAHNYAVVVALDNLSVTIGDGDRLALIGHNGAGKSTLLRLMAGLYHPTNGRVEREGRVSTLFDMGLGMDSDATGYENIYLSGYSRGFTKEEIDELVDPIADFAELGEYINLPMRIYSSGMQARLIFSIATTIEPDILLIDEVFGAGDANFVNKAQQRMQSLLTRSRIVVFASHSAALVQQICNLGLVMDRGHGVFFGPVGEALNRYAALRSAA